MAAHNTQILSPAEVVAGHRHIAAEYGNQADSVVAEAQLRRKSKPIKAMAICSPEKSGKYM